MTNLDGDIDLGEGVTLRIKGLNAAVRAMAKAGADAEDMKDLMHAIGESVIVVARPRTPVITGRLVATLRAGRGKTKAVVRAGGARVPYAGVQHYGWPARNIAPKPFLADAVQASRNKVLSQLDEGLGEILEKNNLK